MSAGTRGGGHGAGIYGKLQVIAGHLFARAHSLLCEAFFALSTLILFPSPTLLPFCISYAYEIAPPVNGTCSKSSTWQLSIPSTVLYLRFSTLQEGQGELRAIRWPVRSFGESPRRGERSQFFESLVTGLRALWLLFLHANCGRRWEEAGRGWNARSSTLLW